LVLMKPPGEIRGQVMVFYPHQDSLKRDHNGGLEWRYRGEPKTGLGLSVYIRAQTVGRSKILDEAEYDAFVSAFKSPLQETLDFEGDSRGNHSAFAWMFRDGEFVYLYSKTAILPRAAGMLGALLSLGFSLFVDAPLGFKYGFFSTPVSPVEVVSFIPTLIKNARQHEGPKDLVLESIFEVLTNNDIAMANWEYGYGGYRYGFTSIGGAPYVMNAYHTIYDTSDPQKNKYVHWTNISRDEYLRYAQQRVDAYEVVKNRYQELLSDPKRLSEFFSNPLLAQRMPKPTIYQAMVGSKLQGFNILPLQVLESFYTRSQLARFGAVRDEIGVSSEIVLRILYHPQVRKHSEWSQWVQQMKAFGFEKDMELVVKNLNQ